MKSKVFLLFIGWLAVVNGEYVKYDEERHFRNSETPVRRATLKKTFHDDFNSLDTHQWVPDVRIAQGLKNQFQIYSPDHQNCYTRGGILYLRPTLTSDKFNETFLRRGVLDVEKQWGRCQPKFKNACRKDASKEGMLPPLMSCHLRSKVAFQYGVLEIKAQMPRGDWLWPGLWLLPKHAHYGPWPRSGEIDIAETSGNLNYGNFGVQRATASLIYGSSKDVKKHIIGAHWLHGTSYGDAMHTYKLDWSPDHIKLYVDDVLIKGVPTPSDGMYKHYGLSGHNIYGNSTNAPFDQEFYVIMSLATGGTMFPDRMVNIPHPKPWSSTDTSRVAMEKFWNHKNDWYSTWHGENAAMKVDSVTIWTYE